MPTADLLRASFPFAGRGYTDVDEMLRREEPDVVVVASPRERHVEHVQLALEHGADVYVEKPFTWDDVRPPQHWLAEARRTVDDAGRLGLLVGINTQYAAAW